VVYTRWSEDDDCCGQKERIAGSVLGIRDLAHVGIFSTIFQVHDLFFS
jgi:hypothetical protein